MSAKVHFRCIGVRQINAACNGASPLRADRGGKHR
jgi:hypothetical protein